MQAGRLSHFNDGCATCRATGCLIQRRPPRGHWLPQRPGHFHLVRLISAGHQRGHGALTAVGKRQYRHWETGLFARSAQALRHLERADRPLKCITSNEDHVFIMVHASKALT